MFFYAKIGDKIFGRSCAEVLRLISVGSLQVSISVLVPLEVSNAVRKHGFGHQARAETDAILSLGIEVFPLEASDLEEVGSVIAEYSVSPYDCAHPVLMRRNGIREVVSADGGLDRFKWLERKDPRHYIRTG